MRRLLVLGLLLGSCGGSLTAASPTPKLPTYTRTTVVTGVFSSTLALSSNATIFVALNKQDASGRDPSGSIGVLGPGMAQIETLPGSSGTGTVSALAVAPDQSLYFARTSNGETAREPRHREMTTHSPLLPQLKGVRAGGRPRLNLSGRRLEAGVNQVKHL